MVKNFLKIVESLLFIGAGVKPESEPAKKNGPGQKRTGSATLHKGNAKVLKYFRSEI